MLAAPEITRPKLNWKTASFLARRILSDVFLHQLITNKIILVSDRLLFFFIVNFLLPRALKASGPGEEQDDG